MWLVPGELHEGDWYIVRSASQVYFLHSPLLGAVHPVQGHAVAHATSTAVQIPIPSAGAVVIQINDARYQLFETDFLLRQSIRRQMEGLNAIQLASSSPYLIGGPSWTM